MRSIRVYGIIGLLIIIISEIFMLLDIRVISEFFTPIVWTGYILLIDSIIFRLRGESLICSRPRQFLVMLLISVVFWLIFELYNIFMPNWHYINQSPHLAVRWLHYIWSFATIYPAIFETAELLQTIFRFDRLSTKKWLPSRKWLYILIAVGLVFLIIPLLQPPEITIYLWILVWLGFIFLLEPINYWLRGSSLLGDLEQGELGRIISLIIAGYICGFLWEFWNFWAYTKWLYTVPFTLNIRIFEMPILGFLGFGPFAIECFVMYQWALIMLRRSGLKIS